MMRELLRALNGELMMLQVDSGSRAIQRHGRGINKRKDHPTGDEMRAALNE